MTLTQLGPNLFQLVSGAQSCTGTLEQIIFLYELDRGEIEIGLVDMLARGNNSMRLGVVGTFLFSDMAKVA